MGIFLCGGKYALCVMLRREIYDKLIIRAVSSSVKVDLPHWGCCVTFYSSSVVYIQVASQTF